jgi:hypothetical protein
MLMLVHREGEQFHVHVCLMHIVLDTGRCTSKPVLSTVTANNAFCCAF